MIDFTKVYCHLHPHELVTNFCNKEECLIGLCANCICTHTQLHVQKGTNPDYENIRTTYKKAQESIHGQVQQFEEHKERIGIIQSKVQEKRDKIREIIDMAKDEVSLLLGNYFEDKEKNMLREIESEEKKLGLHCESRLESLNSYISREVSTLVSAAQELSSNNFLEALPRIRTQCLVNSAKLETDVEIEIAQNERYNTNIECNKGLLNSLIGILERSITLGFSGIPANRVNNPFNGPSNEKIKKEQLNSARRPQSMGKTTERGFLNDPFKVPLSPVPTYTGDRNNQSQVSISQPRYPQPAHDNSNPRQILQHVKSSYLSEIPDFKSELKTVDFNSIPKINSTHAFNSNPSNTQSFNKSYMPNPQQQGILQQIYNPSLNVYSSSRLQERGEDKKQKKLGLKLTNEGEISTRNMENRGPGGYF